jgi:ankyrin repeat protein
MWVPPPARTQARAPLLLLRAAADGCGSRRIARTRARAPRTGVPRTIAQCRDRGVATHRPTPKPPPRTPAPAPKQQGEFPLSFAACTGHKEIAAHLKRHGAAVNKDRDVHGNTALHMTVIHEQVRAAYVGDRQPDGSGPDVARGAAAGLAG